MTKQLLYYYIKCYVLTHVKFSNFDNTNTVEFNAVDKQI